MSKKNLVLSCQVAFTYVGTVVGAGFASGQEILKFFGRYGAEGLLGALAAGVLFALLGGVIVRTSAEQGTRSYKQYARYLFGERMARWVDAIIIFFLYSGLSVMLVASGSLISQVFGCSLWPGFIVAAVVVYLVLLIGLEGVLWLNTLLTPVLLIICGGTAVLGIVQANNAIPIFASADSLLGGSWFVASVLYVAYNSVIGLIILCALGDRPKTACIKGAVTGGLILGGLAAVICQSLLRQGFGVTSHEIPMLALAAQLCPWAGPLYSLALWGAILTTALSNGFGLIKRLESSSRWPRPLLALAVLIPTFPFMGWPFARAVGIIYPLLGYIGVPFIIAIILKIRAPAQRI